MKFADVEHLECFQELIKKAKAGDSEKNWRATLFLLSSPLLARRCAKYVERQKILFPRLMEESRPWSSGEKALVKLAAALFNNSWKIDVNDIFWSLDDDNTALALEAIKIRFRM